MFDGSFLWTPSGIVWIVVIVTAVLAQIVVTARAVRETSKVRSALLESAKKSSLRRITVVLELRRRAASLFDMLDHLAAHQYKKLDVVVIVRSSAGKNASTDLQYYADANGLNSLQVIPYRRGVSDKTVAEKAKGAVLLKLDGSMRLSERFFERVSYGFMAAPDALLVRTYLRPGRTLISAWQSLSSLWRSLFVPLHHRPVYNGQLVAGVPVLKSVIKKESDYSVEPYLFDEYGIDMTQVSLRSRHYSWPIRLVIVAVIIVLAMLVAYLMFDTSPGLLAFVAWLMFAVYIISSLLLLSGLKGLGRLERFLVFALIPFYPLYLVYRAAYQLLELDDTKGSPQVKRPAQPVTR